MERLAQTGHGSESLLLMPQVRRAIVRIGEESEFAETLPDSALFGEWDETPDPVAVVFGPWDEAPTVHNIELENWNG